MNFLKPYGSVFSVFQRLLDACLIMAALYGVSRALDHDWTMLLTAAGALSVGMFLLGAESKRLYGSWRLASIDDEFRSVLVIWAATCCALIIAAFLAKISSNFSRVGLVAWFLTTPALLLLSRLAVRTLLRSLRATGRNNRAVAIVGATSLSQALIAQLEESASFGVRLVGVFDDRGIERIAAEGADATRRVGSARDLIERARRGELDFVFVALPMRAEKRIVDLVNRLADTTASVYVLPDLFTFDLMHARWTTLGRFPAVSVYESPFDGVNGWLKRAEDLVIGSLLLALAALPMLLIAAGIKLSTNGSVLFRQRRYGLSGRVVRVLKFRTMTMSEDGAVISQLPLNDPRITRIGRFLRASSLDELPQLFNVLSGEMSLVGPRPHAVAVNEQYRRLIHGYMLRHKVKPGMTGWAQVNGWHGDDTLAKMQKRVDHDLQYLQHWSLWLDMKILLLTVGAVFFRKNAYSEAEGRS